MTFKRIAVRRDFLSRDQLIVNECPIKGQGKTDWFKFTGIPCSKGKMVPVTVLDTVISATKFRKWRLLKSIAAPQFPVLIDFPGGADPGTKVS